MVRSERIRKEGLGLMSVFIVWHLIAILVVGPSHESKIRSSLYDPYKEYLWLLKLDGPWSFYAPNVAYGILFRYQTVSSTGETNTYPLTEAKKKYEHGYVRNINFYLYFFFNPEYTKKHGYDKSVARYLCSKHAGEDVKEIVFRRNVQKRFTPEDYLAGKNPYGPPFLRHFDYGPYPCSKDQ